MRRVCGATAERDARSRRLCWCRGLFCGKGGARLSEEFRRDVRNDAPAPSLDGCFELLGQQSLIAGDAIRDKWAGRLTATRAPELRLVGKPAAAAASEVEDNG